MSFSIKCPETLFFRTIPLVYKCSAVRHESPALWALNPNRELSHSGGEFGNPPQQKAINPLHPQATLPPPPPQQKAINPLRSLAPFPALRVPNPAEHIGVMWTATRA